MLIPAEIEVKLGFDKIREYLKRQCGSPHSHELVDLLSFETDPDKLKADLLRSAEMQRLIESGSTPPLHFTYDIRKSLTYVATPGTYLQPVDFQDISKALHSGMALESFFKGREEELPELHTLVSKIDVPVELKSRIDGVITEDGQIRDNASKELQRIRTGLQSAANRLRKSLDRIFRQAVKDGFVPEKSSITVRDGRMVIPVHAEYKRRIRGFVHDESATGQTVFLEPAEVLEGNNEIRELEYAERREVIRILAELSDVLRENINETHALVALLAGLDVIRAKARLGIDLESTMPRFESTPTVSLVNARHPLLYQNYKEQKKDVVPLSLALDSHQRIMIISGPNAGGKSVCLKTVGLVQYMWQCGLLVPVDEASEMGIFEDIFLDIGDEQSIDNDLSTYSSHLTLMKQFVGEARKKSLVLIDEFGTGTDPQFGGAVAQGILVELIRRKCRGVITTHYGNIKSFAEEHPNVINGAMKYDVENLRPMYMLQAGVPGSSFTFEVARKIGLPGEIIDYARESIGEETTNVEDLLLQLEKQKQRNRMRDKQLSEQEEETSRLREKYARLLDQLESNKKDIIKKAKEEASDLLKQTNREIEKTIRHIKENRAEKKETRRVRDKLDTLKTQMHEKASKPIRETEETQELKVGDAVRIIGKDVVGEVMGMKGKDVEIQIGALKTTAKRNTLELISRGEAKKAQKKFAVNKSNVDLNQKLAAFSQTLDVRGKRGNEILEIVDKFIDDALLFNANELRILHGKGDGILRTLIRHHLRHHPHVDQVKDEHVDFGGAGISVVYMK